MAEQEKQIGLYRRWATALRNMAAESWGDDRDMLIRAAEVYERITRRMESTGDLCPARTFSMEQAIAA
jgi:hypothetical protein